MCNRKQKLCLCINKEGQSSYRVDRKELFPNHNKLLCKSPQGPLPVEGIASAVEQKCSRVHQKSRIPGLLHLPFLGSKTQQLVETYSGPQYSEQIFKDKVIQNGDPRDNKNLTTSRGVGNIHRFQRRILPHTDSQSVQEVHAFSCPGSVLQVQSPTIQPVHSPNGVYNSVQ